MSNVDGNPNASANTSPHLGAANPPPSQGSTALSSPPPKQRVTEWLKDVASLGLTSGQAVAAWIGILAMAGLTTAVLPKPATQDKEVGELRKEVADLKSQIEGLKRSGLPISPGSRGGVFTIANVLDYNVNNMQANAWTDTGQALSLPSAGTYLVLYNAQTFTQDRVRADTVKARLALASGTTYPERGIPGVESSNVQTGGELTIMQLVTTSGADQLRVQVQNNGGTSATIQLRSGIFAYAYAK